MNGGGRSSNRRTRGLVLTPINELNDNDYKVNLFGVVLETSFLSKTRRSDYSCIMKIVDQSKQEPELSVSIFDEDIRRLPLVKSNGDMILLLNVNIEMFNGNVSVAFSKKYSSFALFNGSISGDTACYQSSRSYALTSTVINSLTNLRTWFSTAQLQSCKPEYLLTMSTLSEECYFDLVCLVLHVSYDDAKGLWMLYVWDGDDAPPLCINGRLKAVEKNPLPLCVESSPLDRPTLGKFFRLGTVLRVYADTVHENLGLLALDPRKWVMIRNMNCKIQEGMWVGNLNHSSKLRLLNDDDSFVLDCKSKYKDRKATRDRLPMGTLSTLTEIEFKDFQFLTLMDVITYNEDEEAFCCVVRVIAIHPFGAEDFSSPDGMLLTLEDPTARIRVHLSAEEWKNFIKEIDPSEVMSKMRKLIGVAEHEDLSNDPDLTRFPPWVACCICSRKGDDSDERVYSLCRTKMVGSTPPPPLPEDIL